MPVVDTLVGDSNATTIPLATGHHVVLFNSATALQPPLQLDAPAALITRFADRARDRHAREDEFHAYDHYLSFYWEHRTLGGIGLTAAVSGGEAYQDDGRARSLDEAIRWHGGEAKNSKEAYLSLNAVQKTAILSFLATL